MHTTLAPFGALTTTWTVDTDCPDCLHAAYEAAVLAQHTGENVVQVGHGGHDATATLATEAAILTPFGALSTTWAVNTDCPDCLHAAYAAATQAQHTGESTVTVHHGQHAATASCTY